MGVEDDVEHDEHALAVGELVELHLEVRAGGRREGRPQPAGALLVDADRQGLEAVDHLGERGDRLHHAVGVLLPQGPVEAREVGAVGHEEEVFARKVASSRPA